MPTRTRILLAALALTLPSLSFLAPPATAADPMVGAPAEGQCFDMSAAELAPKDYTEAPVDCAAAHTSQIFHVGLMPEGARYDNEDEWYTATNNACQVKVAKLVHKNPLAVHLTAYTFAMFAPTAEQQAAGARWFRCDIILIKGGTNPTPLPLPSSLKAGKYPFADKIARCLTPRTHYSTVCTQKHDYRATTALRVTGKNYPSEAAWKRIGTKKCPGHVTTRTYTYGWATKYDWAAGAKYIVCYSKTSK